ncbi:MAG: hypothetical protein JWO35_492 [Candidatus Saccharibacteria bacterium]|nr:hypothetical protein [Candidatus Saccharibacteria bacterium]
MAAAAEQIKHGTLEPHGVPEVQPLVLVVPEMAEDVFSRHAAGRFIASVALKHDVSCEAAQDSAEKQEGQTSLYEKIHSAANGDEEARKLIYINVLSDMVERSIKAGIVMEVPLEVDESNTVSQFGQSLESVNANTLLYASANKKMLARSKAEARNAFRIKHANMQGKFEDYNMVVFSCVSDDMTRQEQQDVGFFVETMSCAIQVTSLTEDGLQLESVFIAGIKEGESERHDIEAIVKLAAAHGVDYSNMTTTEILDTPLLVHKSLMPNGGVDVAKALDQIIDGTFMGQDKPVQDYVAFKESCKQREAAFGPRAEKVTQQLINEHASITSPLQAIQRLNKLSQVQSVDHAIKDKTIDARVFGPGAPYIEQARLHEQMGNMELAGAARNVAQTKSKSNSCPSGMQKGQEAGSEGEAGSTDGEASSDTKSGKINCIKCRKSVKKIDVVKAASWRCPSCKYEVDICNGKELNPSEPPEEQERLAEVISLEEKRREKQLAKRVLAIAAEQNPQTQMQPAKLSVAA